jgi:hypothetical protein
MLLNKRKSFVPSPSAIGQKHLKKSSKLFIKKLKEKKVQKDLSSSLNDASLHAPALLSFQGGFSALNQKTNKLCFHSQSEPFSFCRVLTMEALL